MSELDLADVPPTAHPLEIANAWAEDEPRAVPAARRRLRERARPRRRLLPGAARMTSTRCGSPPRRRSSCSTRKEVSRRGALRRLPRSDRRARPELHAYLHRLRRRRAGEGIPIALKDVIGTKGVPTTAGSKILESYVPVYDATVAANCKAARAAAPRQDEHRRVRDGLVDRELGVRPVAQPLGPDARPGRLGRRLAAAVSGGLAPWALGSDTGGSIKQPAALCGNVGLRPTYGTVSRYGVVAFASSLDQVGPVAKNVRDCAWLYSIIAGPRRERLDDGRRAGGRAADCART